MLWIAVFNDVGLKWLDNGKGTDLYGLTQISYYPGVKIQS